MRPDPSPPEELDRIEAMIDRWVGTQAAENPAVEAVERDATPDERRWFVRVRGEEKDVFTVWFHLRQRSLRTETYFMPAPEEQAELLWEHLLRRNAGLFGFRFEIGPEDAVYLVAQTPNGELDVGTLDRLLGSAYAYVEQCFRPAMRIGFAGRFRA